MTQQLREQSVPAPVPKITYEQFLAQTPEDAHVEWVNGEVVAMAPISNEHQNLSLFLLTLIQTFVTHRKLGIVRYEPFQMKTGPNLPGRSPDILFLANENRHRLKPVYLDGPADLVVEIISPDSRARDRGEKFYEYEEGGVREYWLVDPARKQAEFYLLGNDRLYHPAVLTEGAFQSLVLKPLSLKIDLLWQDPLPPADELLRQQRLI